MEECGLCYVQDRGSLSAVETSFATTETRGGSLVGLIRWPPLLIGGCRLDTAIICDGRSRLTAVAPIEMAAMNTKTELEAATLQPNYGDGSENLAPARDGASSRR